MEKKSWNISRFLVLQITHLRNWVIFLVIFVAFKLLMSSWWLQWEAMKHLFCLICSFCSGSSRAISKIIFILGSYKFLAYLECIKSYTWSFGHSDPDLSSVHTFADMAILNSALEFSWGICQYFSADFHANISSNLAERYGQSLQKAPNAHFLYWVLWFNANVIV